MAPIFDPDSLHEVVRTVLDLPLEERVSTLVARLSERFPGHIARDDEWIFNNAGGGGYWLPFEETDVALLDRTLRTNIRGAFLCTQEALKHMQRGGAVVNTASTVICLPARRKRTSSPRSRPGSNS